MRIEISPWKRTIWFLSLHLAFAMSLFLLYSVNFECFLLSTSNELIHFIIHSIQTRHLFRNVIFCVRRFLVKFMFHFILISHLTVSNSLAFRLHRFAVWIVFHWTTYQISIIHNSARFHVHIIRHQNSNMIECHSVRFPLMIAAIFNWKSSTFTRTLPHN